MGSVAISEARANLPDILKRVAEGEEVTLTRHGVAVAVVVRPDALRSRHASDVFAEAAELGKRLQEARRRPRPTGKGISTKYAEELVAEIRAGRDSRR
jgi:prevent-host-death family protein